MVVALWALTAWAAPGFELESHYASAWGADAWATVHLQADAGETLQVGALVLGGTRSAVLATAAKRHTWAELVTTRLELQLGMRRTAVDASGGPLIGAQGDAWVHATPDLDVALSTSYLPDVGGWFSGGLDAQIAPPWTLSPRLRLGTWAGDRDTAVRVSMGLTPPTRAGWFVAADIGAGGRDTVHMGPSATLTLGHRGAP